MNEPTETIKIAFFGGDCVGKFYLILRMVQDKFSDEYEPKFAIVTKKNITFNNKQYTLNLLNIPGMEVNYLRPQFVRSYDCFVLVYSVNDHYSFELINDIYNTICRYKDSDHFPCVICANKIDLENERIIKSEEGKALAEQLGVRYVEASAKTGQGVIELFETAVKEYLKYNGIEDEPKVPKLAKRKEVCNVQ